jgi:nucleotide-binding universal stress UspA family protein
MYERILVPTDGSGCAEAAVDHALAVAERFDAAIHALYVVEADVVGHSAPAVDPETVRTALRTEGEAATGAIRERATDRGLDADAAVVEGIPEDAILEYVDDEGIDLVVMGTHGRRGLDRYLVGSVTERIVRRTDVPVLVVRDEE